MVRQASLGDVRDVHELLQELATYEGNLTNFTASEDELARSIFGHEPKMSSWVVEDSERIIAMAICTQTIIAVSCLPVLRLLALVVRDGHRGRGIGSSLLTAIYRHTLDEGCASIEFMVRESNEGAKAFYSRWGGVRREGWETWRITAAAFGLVL